MPFEVLPWIDDIVPRDAWPGDPVTLLGRGFGDLDGNGTVDGPDYTEVLSNWGAVAEPTEPGGVPELATSVVSDDQAALEPAPADDEELVSPLQAVEPVSTEAQDYQAAAANWLYYRGRKQRNARGIHARSRFESAVPRRADRLVPTIQMPIQLSIEDEPLDILNLLQPKLPLDV